MRHLIKNYSNFILENVDNNVNLIEDCFLEFCDNYNLDITIDSGFMINNGFLTLDFLPEIIKHQGIEKDIQNVFRVQFYNKSFREERNELIDKMSINWSSNMNYDLKNCISRVVSLSNNSLDPVHIPIATDKSWGITFYFKII